MCIQLTHRHTWRNSKNIRSKPASEFWTVVNTVSLSTVGNSVLCLLLRLHEFYQLFFFFYPGRKKIYPGKSIKALNQNFFTMNVSDLNSNFHVVKRVFYDFEQVAQQLTLSELQSSNCETGLDHLSLRSPFLGVHSVTLWTTDWPWTYAALIQINAEVYFPFSLPAWIPLIPVSTELWLWSRGL